MLLALAWAAASPEWAYARYERGGELDFDGGWLARRSGQTVLALWDDRTQVAVEWAGPGVRVRRAQRGGRTGVQATFPSNSTEMLLHVRPEDRSIEHWQGWNRSWAVLVSGFVREAGQWTLLARFRAQTSPHSASALRSAELRDLVPANAEVWTRSGQVWAPLGDNGAVPTALSGSLPREVANAPFRWEGEEWGQHAGAKGLARCRPPEEAPVQLEAVQRLPWCGEGGGVLPALHFWWTLPEGENVEWLYNSITVEASAPNSFFMGIGWEGGYFGVQEHANASERYALFSVWDAADVVDVVALGARVQAGRFGREGTGVNSHVRFPWREGIPIELALHADFDPASGRTTYGGWVLDEGGVWRLLAKLRTRACGERSTGYVQKPNSFLEVWLPDPQCLHRSASYGPLFYRVAQPLHAPGDVRPASPASTGWRQASAVALSATCGLGTGGINSCPHTGLNASVAALEVGGGVVNALPGSFGPELVGALPPVPTPSVLDAPVPLADGSPGRGRRSPLLRWGARHSPLEPFGASSFDAPVCPWYVVDCEA